MSMLRSDSTAGHAILSSGPMADHSQRRIRISEGWGSAADQPCNGIEPAAEQTQWWIMPSCGSCLAVNHSQRPIWASKGHAQRSMRPSGRWGPAVDEAQRSMKPSVGSHDQQCIRPMQRRTRPIGQSGPFDKLGSSVNQAHRWIRPIGQEGPVVNQALWRVSPCGGLVRRWIWLSGGWDTNRPSNVDDKDHALWKEGALCVVVFYRRRNKSK